MLLQDPSGTSEFKPMEGVEVQWGDQPPAAAADAAAAEPAAAEPPAAEQQQQGQQ